jgi:hypothetical protein
VTTCENAKERRVNSFFIHSVDVSSSDTCDEDQEKRDDARSNSRLNTTILDWFRPSCGVIALRLVFTVSHYEI